MSRQKYEEISLNELMWGPDYYPYDYQTKADEIVIRLKSRPHPCPCPHCGQTSDVRASTYERLIQDIPARGKTTYLSVRAYKYRCMNPNCKAVSFNEILPFAHSIQRRTDRLNELILAVSLYLSAEGASQVLRMLGVRISNDAIQALWSHVVFEDRPDVSEIGVDDVAVRKGCTYATAIYDKRDGAMLALLEGRDGGELRKWLENHPRIERVARDRAGAYAKAVADVLPGCTQVADRYHLFANLSDRLYAYFREEMPEQIIVQDGIASEAPAAINTPKYTEKRADVSGLHYDASTPLDADGEPIPIDTQRHQAASKQTARNAASRQKKKALVMRVQALYAEGKNYSEICRETGVSHSTAKRYAHMTPEETEALDRPARRASRKNRVGEEYFPIMYKMMVDGHDDVTILSYLRAQGCDAALGTLHSRMLAISRNHFPERKAVSHPNKLLQKEDPDTPDGTVRLKRSEVFYGLMTLDEKKIAAKGLSGSLSAICDSFPAAREIRRAAQDFHNAVFSDAEASIAAFIEKYHATFLSGFCAGLVMDLQAVRNAAAVQLSSGWVEGSNNKFKLIKRTMYGRADLPCLEHKCIAVFAAECCTRSVHVDHL